MKTSYVVRPTNKNYGNGITGGTIEYLCGDCLVDIKKCGCDK